MNYKKLDLIDRVAEKAGISKAEAERQISNVFEGVTELLGNMTEGDKLQLVGLLSFDVKHKQAYVAKNPKTGEDVEVPASNKLRVKAGKLLVDAVQ